MVLHPAHSGRASSIASHRSGLRYRPQPCPRNPSACEAIALGRRARASIWLRAGLRGLGRRASWRSESGGQRLVDRYRGGRAGPRQFMFETRRLRRAHRPCGRQLLGIDFSLDELSDGPCLIMRDPGRPAAARGTVLAFDFGSEAHRGGCGSDGNPYRLSS